MKKLIASLALYLIVLLAGCQKPVVAPTLNTFQQLEQHILSRMDRHQLAGLSVAVVNGEQTVWDAAYGKANLEKQRSVGPTTLFKAASLAKPVTALLVLKLVEDGRLDLDRNVSDYLPFAVVHPSHPGEKITTRHLLTHTSGITDEEFARLLEGEFATAGADHPLSLAAFCRGMLDKQGEYYTARSFSKHKPGTTYVYSNLAVALAGFLVEVVSGMPFESFSRKVLFEPLGLKHTHWRLAETALDSIAMPYDKKLQPYGLYTTVDVPAGGLLTTAADMARILSLIMADGRHQGRQLYQPATIREMKRPQFPEVKHGDLAGHGLLLERSQPGFYALTGHNGQAPGANALMWYNEEKKAGAVLLLNRDYGTSDCLQDIINTLDEAIHLGGQ